LGAIVTLSGIDKAINNLGYSNEKQIKTRVIRTLRQFYSDENSVLTVTKVNPDDLIRLIWDTGNSIEAIKNKRKNFSSIKSSINSELTRLYSEGRNPEGIIIGKNNTFDMSDKAKSELLENFTGGGDGDSIIPLGKINDVLGIVNDILKKTRSGSEIDSHEDRNNFNQLKDLIQSISQKIGRPYNPDQIQGPADGLCGKYRKEGADGTGSGDQPESEGESDKGLIRTSQDKNPPIEPDTGKGTGQAGDTEDNQGFKTGITGSSDGLQKSGSNKKLNEVEDLEEIAGADFEEISEDEIGEDAVLEDIEEADIDELPEEELDEAEEILEDAPEEVEELDALEEVQEAEELDGVEGDIEEADELPVEEVEGDIKEVEADAISDERVLADEFNNMLSEMDRFYNQYILIPRGRYPVGGKDTRQNGNTADKADIKEFYFAKFPVTNALFEIFIEKTGYVTTAEKIGHGIVYYGRYKNTVDIKTGLKTLNWNSALETKVVEGACWHQPSGPGSTLHNKRNHPVVQVSLEDAMAFAKWTGKRIPTEAQWEAASRTLNGYRYPWGKDYKNGYCNIEDSHIGDTTPVDKYQESENSLGIMDVLGNVMEWTLDPWKPVSGDKHGSLFVVKGGSWISGDDLSLYDRSYSEPEATSNILGFRCIAY